MIELRIRNKEQVANNSNKTQNNISKDIKREVKQKEEKYKWNGRSHKGKWKYIQKNKQKKLWWVYQKAGFEQTPTFLEQVCPTSLSKLKWSMLNTIVK